MAQTTFPLPIKKPTGLINRYPASLQALICKLQQTPYFSPDQVCKLVEAAAIPATDLVPWADFSHPVADSYGRKLVYYGGHFEIMVMTWLPGDVSAIHDHGATQWGAVQCFGSAEHFIYPFTPSGSGGILGSPQAAPYYPGMVRAVDHSLIHQMGNPGNQPFLSLHVYGCASMQTSITGGARIFDLFEGSIQHTDGGVFFCLPEAQITHRIYGLGGDLLATRLHHQQMIYRIQRILSHRPNAELQQKLLRLKSSLALT